MATIVMDPIEVTGTLSAPNLSLLTTGSLTGTGAFDRLMAVTKLHLVEEYEQERITKDEYATVYLGALQGVLAQSVQYLLNHQSQEKIIAEIGLIRQKTVTELAQTDNTILDNLGFNGTPDVEGIVAKNLEILEQQRLESVEKVKTAAKQAILTGQQIVTELAQTDDSLSGASTYGLNDAYTAIEGMLAADKAKTKAEQELAEQKVVTEIGQVNSTLPANYGKNANTVLSGLMKSSQDKTAAEIQLLDQKSVSELAQTHDTVPVNSGSLQPASYPVSGVVGKQKLLFEKQTAGFDRDAEQKLAKIMTEVLIANIAADNGTVLTGTNLDNANIGVVISNAMGGIGDTPV
jgi:hypothetical protein